MRSKIAKKPAKIPAANSGPRQLSTARSSGRSSDMAEQLPLVLAVGRDRHRRQRVRPIPNAIEKAQAAAQFLRNLRSGFDRGLWPPTPPAREFIEILAICAIAANRQPFPLCESG